MANKVEYEGNSEEEAVAEACAALGVEPDSLKYELVDGGAEGVFGLGARPVRIRLLSEDEAVDTSEEETADVEETEVSASADEDAEDEGEGKESIGPAPEKAAKAKEVAAGLASRMGLSAKISVRDQDKQIVVVIEEEGEGSTVADILGRSRPPAIPSFQFLLNKIVNRFPEDRKHIIVEVPAVPRRERRQDKAGREDRRRNDNRQQAQSTEPDPNLDPSLVELAKFLAGRAQQMKQVITVHPMMPSDRRAIHQTIMTIDGVHTVSEGEGLYRRMHIVPDVLKGDDDKDASKKKRRRRRRRRREDEEGGGSEEAAAAESSEENGNETIETQPPA